MELSTRTKMIIFVAIIIVVGYLFFSTKDSAMHNDGSLTQNDTEVERRSEIKENEVQDTTNAKYASKYKTLNSAPAGEYAYSNYKEGKRGGAGKTTLDNFFEDGALLNENENVMNGTMSDDYAGYATGKSKKLTDIDKFDVDALLPQDRNKDWFDDPYSGASIKNTHLINIYRPIGVNTIQTSLKNPSWDIRGAPVNPKTVISPFLNSSYEPDTNIRNQSLCF